MSTEEKLNVSSAPEGNPAETGRFSGGVEMLSKALKTVFVVLAVSIIALLIWFLTCGGSFIVDSTTQSVIVLKFGKFYGEYQEGWHWFLPYPVNRIVRIPTRKETVVTQLFMPSNAAKIRDPNAKTLLGNDAGDLLIPGVDGYALLGDNAIMHSEWVLSYRIGDPIRFYLNCVSGAFAGIGGDSVNAEADSETVRLDAVSAMLKSLLDSSVIEASSVLTLDSTYYNSDQYLQSVRTVLQKKIDALDIGVVMDNLTLSMVAPPLKTQIAFQEYLLAKTRAEREVEAARTYKVEQKNLADAEAEKIESEGLIRQQRIVSDIRADAAYFQKILVEFDKNPDATVFSLYSAGLARALEKVKEKYIVSTDEASKSEVRLKINPETDQKKDTGKTNGEEKK